MFYVNYSLSMLKLKNRNVKHVQYKMIILKNCVCVCVCVCVGNGRIETVIKPLYIKP